MVQYGMVDKLIVCDVFRHLLSCKQDFIVQQDRKYCRCNKMYICNYCMFKVCSHYVIESLGILKKIQNSWIGCVLIFHCCYILHAIVLTCLQCTVIPAQCSVCCCILYRSTHFLPMKLFFSSLSLSFRCFVWLEPREREKTFVFPAVVGYSKRPCTLAPPPATSQSQLL